MAANYQKLKESLEKLYERRSRNEYELSNPENPNSLEAQLEKAKGAVKSTFDQLRELLDKREKVLLDKIEVHFDEKSTPLMDEIADINKIIEDGENILKEYNVIIGEGGDANFLMQLLGKSDEIKKVIDASKRYEGSFFIPTLLEVVFEESDEVFERIKSLGEITESSIQAPQNFGVASRDCESVNLLWDRTKEAFPVTYRVVFRKTGSGNNKWAECYNGSEVRCRCSNLQSNTGYEFKIFSVCNGIRSAKWNTCTARTVNEHST